MDALNRHCEYMRLLIMKTYLMFLSVRSEGGADCLKLQEANGGGSGGENGGVKSEGMEGVVNGGGIPKSAAVAL